MHQWTVVSGLVEGDGGLLLVANRRRGGEVDWSPPGGVVDAGEQPHAALTREVAEETGLVVARWWGPVYEVRVLFDDHDSELLVAVYRASSWTGRLVVDDPDGIVFDAAFLDDLACRARLDLAPAWVADPLVSWMEDPGGPFRRFDYRVAGGREPGSMVVERA